MLHLPEWLAGQVRLNLENNQYEAVGEMFIYLMLCPKFMFDWTSLYIDLIQHASPDNVMQTLNRILITGGLKKDKTIVDISRRILRKITNKLSLKFQHIDRYYKGVPKITIENIEKINQTSNISPKIQNLTKEAPIMKESNIQLKIGNSCTSFNIIADDRVFIL